VFDEAVASASFSAWRLERLIVDDGGTSTIGIGYHDHHRAAAATTTISTRRSSFARAYAQANDTRRLLTGYRLTAVWQASSQPRRR